MLNVFYLIAITLGVSGQSVVKKAYTQKTDGKGVYFFGVLSSAVALLFFAVTSSGFHFDVSFVPYSIGFAAAYTISAVFMVLAITYGSLSLTSLFTSYSLLLPTAYGLILGDDISAGFIPGMILLVISLFLTNKTDETVKISFKWIVFVFLSFIGNGMCTVVQKMQQVASNGAYKHEFMILALAIVVVVMLIPVLFSERKDIKFLAKSGWHWGTVCGALNGMVNLFVMILSGRMAVSLMFPLISAGGLIVTYFVSAFVYKEKLTKVQFAGFIFGLAAVVLLNM